MVAPPQGTANVVVQTGAVESIVAGATTFFGVDQVQPFGTPAAFSGNSGNPIQGNIASASSTV